MKHYSEAELLDTYYTQPGESMPVMMHLAGCSDCAARYHRLEQKLREAAVCSTEKPETFWARQRLQIMRRVSTQQAPVAAHPRTLRVAAAALLAFILGGAVVYESVQPARQPVTVVKIVPTTAATTPSPSVNETPDPWQSDELKDFHNVVEWETWVPENTPEAGKRSSL